MTSLPTANAAGVPDEERAEHLRVGFGRVVTAEAALDRVFS